jgi:hypothetical protein
MFKKYTFSFQNPVKFVSFVNLVFLGFELSKFDIFLGV